MKTNAVAAVATTSSPNKAQNAPLPDTRVHQVAATAWQVLLLSAIWLAAEALRSRMGWGIPAGLIGFSALAMGLFSGLVQPRWLARGTRWLLADMLLFFIPAMLVVVDYGDLVRHQGLRILAVIVLSTISVMVMTALTVDAVYRLELRLAQRKRSQQRVQAAAKGAR